MTTVQDLTKAFSQSCVGALNKGIGKVLVTSDKKIKNFASFLNKKQFRKIDPEADDRGRYNAMMEAIIEFVRVDESLIEMLLDATSYFNDLKELFVSDEVYDMLSENYLKGSFKMLSPQLNKLFNPKKDDEPSELLDNLKYYVKPYAINFSELLHDASTLHVYRNSALTFDKLECTAMDLILAGVEVLSIYTGEDTCVSLWITDTELDGAHGGFESIDADGYMSSLNSAEFELNTVHNIGLDTIKSDFVGERFDMFVSHAAVLSKSSKLRCYRTTYKWNSDFDDITEERMNNAIGGIGRRYEDFKKKIFASFTFNGTVGDVNMETFWLMMGDVIKDDDATYRKAARKKLNVENGKKDDEDNDDVMKSDVLPPDEANVFKWIDITTQEFVDHMKDKGTLGRILIH